MSKHRLTLRYAATWHLLAELLRRHHHAHDLRAYWYFPGISANGVVMLRRPAGDVLLRCDLVHCHTEVPEGTGGFDGDYVAELLAAEDPKDVIDAVEAAMGLAPHRGPLAHPSGAVQCARVIAAVLARRMLGRTSYRTSPAYADNAGSVRVLDWVAHLPEVQAAVDVARARAADDNIDESPLVQHLFALHAGPEVLSGPGADEHSFVAFDLRAGVAHLMHRHGQRSSLALTHADTRGGRRLGELVDWVDASL
ncbi:MAG: hypothetical protein IPH80_09285 [Myxococcales bacterium]|jgi:hypothetical protein|nr:hypothetical protein [Myxococcales bacterium]